MLTSRNKSVLIASDKDNFSDLWPYLEGAMILLTRVNRRCRIKNKFAFRGKLGISCRVAEGRAL